MPVTKYMEKNTSSWSLDPRHMPHSITPAALLDVGLAYPTEMKNMVKRKQNKTKKDVFAVTVTRRKRQKSLYDNCKVSNNKSMKCCGEMKWYIISFYF